MKFSAAALALAFTTSAVVAAPMMKRGVPENLVPDFGHPAGLNPTGTGDCDGVPGPNGQPIKVPCACPPDRGAFIASLNANVDAGHAVNNPGIGVAFPTGPSQGDQLARINAALVTLQNLNGPGKGCPASATTFVAQQKAIQEGRGAPPPAPPPPPPPAAAPPPPPPAPAGTNIDALAPQLEFTAGRNPTGTGDCDGAVNGPNGQPIKIPCACPPNQADFNRALAANVAAGHAVNNPGVAVSFPTGNSNGEKAARITAGLITLQNLNGPGKGCPAVSSTLSAQLKAVQ